MCFDFERIVYFMSGFRRIAHSAGHNFSIVFYCSRGRFRILWGSYQTWSSPYTYNMMLGIHRLNAKTIPKTQSSPCVHADRLASVILTPPSPLSNMHNASFSVRAKLSQSSKFTASLTQWFAFCPLESRLDVLNFSVASHAFFRRTDRMQTALAEGLLLVCVTCLCVYKKEPSLCVCALSCIVQDPHLCITSCMILPTNTQLTMLTKMLARVKIV